MILEIGTAQSV